MGKPSSANLLARARSYQLQIWWEIQPRVKEVYPQGCRNKDLLAVSSGEDKVTTRAQGRVDAEKFHLSRERQEDEGQREVLEKSRRSVPAHKACRELQGGAQSKHQASKKQGD